MCDAKFIIDESLTVNSVRGNTCNNHFPLAASQGILVSSCGISDVPDKNIPT